MNDLDGYQPRVSGAITTSPTRNLTCDRCGCKTYTLSGLEKKYPDNPDKWVCSDCFQEMFGKLEATWTGLRNS